MRRKPRSIRPRDSHIFGAPMPARSDARDPGEPGIELVVEH
jgi:hypothetical protein